MLNLRSAIMVKKIKRWCYSSEWKPISEQQSVTCHMGSHSVTRHPTQVNAPRLNLSQIGWYSIYVTQRDERLN